MKADLTFAYVNERLNYEPATGLFRYKIVPFNHRRLLVGSVAGHRHKKYGYVRIKIDNRIYSAHRLAWLLAYGEWPKQMLDHINRNSADNRIANLRLSNPRQNNSNARTNRKYVGVTKTGSGRFSARLGINRKLIHLGTFDSEELAVAVRKSAIQKIEGEQQ